MKVGNGYRKEKCLLEIFLIDFSIHQASNLLSCLNNTISSLKQRLFQIFNSFRNPNVARFDQIPLSCDQIEKSNCTRA